MWHPCRCHAHPSVDYVQSAHGEAEGRTAPGGPGCGKVYIEVSRAFVLKSDRQQFKAVLAEIKQAAQSNSKWSTLKPASPVGPGATGLKAWQNANAGGWC